MELTLGIDLGTHGARALLVDARGEIYGQGRHAYARRLKSGGIQEQPLEPVWAGLCEAARQAVAGLSPLHRVAGLAVTHQRGTVVALDWQDEPVGPAICDSDLRSRPQARWLAEEIGPDRLYQLTGCPPLPFNGLSKILWQRQEAPWQTARIKRWTSIQDWAVLRLTGQRVSSPGAALRLGVLNVAAGNDYAHGLLAKLELEPYLFMPMRSFGQALGDLSPAAAPQLDLPAGTPVFPAPGDQPAAVLGAGAAGRGEALVNLGTSFLTSFPLRAPAAPTDGVNYTLEVLPEQRYALELGTGAGTNVLDWLRESLFQLSTVALFNQLAGQSPRGANGVRVIPHWWSALDEQITGGIQGLNSTHTRADIARATLESLAYEVRWAWDQLRWAVGASPARIALCGGASGWDTLCQLLADVLHCPTYRLTTSEASALGAAMSAALGLAWFPSVESAAREMSHPADVFEPRGEAVDFYQTAYHSYLTLRP